jgi:hypothetical protein
VNSLGTRADVSHFLYLSHHASKSISVERKKQPDSKDAGGQAQGQLTFNTSSAFIRRFSSTDDTISTDRTVYIKISQ